MNKPGIRKQFFAWALKKADKINLQVYDDYKKDLFTNISGTVVEIGPGTGVNFEYLPANVKWIGIEPNAAFFDILSEKSRKLGISAELIFGTAEQIPLADETADVMICTLVLCSVKNLATTLAEIKRVLKKGGKLIFIEHVAAQPNSWLHFFQDLFNPLNKILADGCHCNRETWTSIEQAQFSDIQYTHQRIHDAIIFHQPHIMGYAIK